MQEYRLVMQYKKQDAAFENDKIPKKITDLGLRHGAQIEILQKIQDRLLNKQSEYLKEDINYCPKCGNKLHKNGINKCSFNARINQLTEPVSNDVQLKKLYALKQYITNNESKIINYNARKDQNLIFTSNLAECSIESLINQRCKGKKHMQWSREGGSRYFKSVLHQLVMIGNSIGENILWVHIKKPA